MGTNRRLTGGRAGRLASLCGIAVSSACFGQAAEDSPGGPDLRQEQPEQQPVRGGREQPGLSEGGDLVTFSAFSEAMELTELVDMVASILEINVNIDPSLSGQVMFNQGFSVPRADLLDTLNALLEQQGYLLTQDPRTRFYSVVSKNDVPVVLDSRLATTRLIPTQGLRPSALREAISTALGIPLGGQQSAGDRIAYIDEAGLIVVTGAPGRIEQVQTIADAIISEYLSLQYVRFELQHIAAPVAREHILEVVTGQAEGEQGQGVQRPGAPVGVGGASGPLDSIPERLRVDPQDNALLFRGRPDEIVQLQAWLALIDKASSLTHRRFFTGSATLSVAQFASAQGLGEVVTFGELQQETGGRTRLSQVNPQNQPGQVSRGVTRGGPVLVVDEQRGFIIHYATPSQHRTLEQLVEQLDAPSEEIVIRAYKLEHAVASEVADLLTGILQNQSVRRDDQGSLLPQNQGGGVNQQQARRLAPINPDAESDDPNEVRVEQAADEVFVVADEAHNQVLVKASVRQQREVGKLIERIDLRQAQVFLDVKIVSISDTDTFRLAIESQVINAGGQPVAQTNFGLTGAGDGGILDPRIVSPGLGGLTTAVILSDQVPFVLNAIQTVTDARILANPTLLVNDNADGRIDDVREEPFTERTIGDGGVERQSTDFAEAGTTVEVTPRISSGGYLTLEYSVIFSNFIGDSTGDGPPPINRREVNSVASLPTDSTMVLGGITVDNLVNTVVKVPLIGDIPLVGHLFRDTSRTKTDSLLYIFITPRILSDRNFAGQRLIAEGPMKISEIEPDAPELRPSLIPIIERQGRRGVSEEPPIGLGDGEGAGG